MLSVSHTDIFKRWRTIQYRTTLKLGLPAEQTKARGLCHLLICSCNSCSYPQQEEERGEEHEIEQQDQDQGQVRDISNEVCHVRFGMDAQALSSCVHNVLIMFVYIAKEEVRYL